MSGLGETTHALLWNIGHLVVLFQSVEYGVAEVLASVLGMKQDQDTERVLAAMSFSQKVDLLCDLYPARKPSKWPDIDVQVVRSALRASEEFRNTVVHSFWYVGDDGWERMKASLRSKGELRTVRVTADADAIGHAAAEIMTIRDWYLGNSDAVREATRKLRAINASWNSASSG